MKEIKMPYLDVFGFIPKIIWTTSSWIGALVVVGSLQPNEYTLNPYLSKCLATFQ